MIVIIASELLISCWGPEVGLRLLFHYPHLDVLPDCQSLSQWRQWWCFRLFGGDLVAIWPLAPRLFIFEDLYSPISGPVPESAKIWSLSLFYIAPSVSFSFAPLSDPLFIITLESSENKSFRSHGLVGMMLRITPPLSLYNSIISSELHCSAIGWWHLRRQWQRSPGCLFESCWCGRFCLSFWRSWGRVGLCYPAPPLLTWRALYPLDLFLASLWLLRYKLWLFHSICWLAWMSRSTNSIKAAALADSTPTPLITITTLHCFYYCLLINFIKFSAIKYQTRDSS